MQTQAKWINELKKTLLNQWKAMKTVQLTSISISQGWKTGNYNTVIQICCIYKTCPKSAQIVSECRDDEDQMSKIENLPKTANDLGWHSCFLAFRQSLYTILIIEICYNRQIREK